MNETNGSDPCLSNCYLEISSVAIAHNLSILREKTRSRIMAVIKSNGYGLGLLEYARLLTGLGVTDLAVGSYDEAMSVRKGGIDAAMLLLTPQISVEAIKNLILAGVTLTVGSAVQCEAVGRAAEETGVRPGVHIKLDTGLGRYGFEPHELQNVKKAVGPMDVKGIYTHFASPYGSFKTTRRQFEAFTRSVKHLGYGGVNTGTLHCCASGGLLNYPIMHLDMVRTGSALLGRVPGALDHGLVPAVALKAPILAIKSSPGRRIGYRGAISLPGKSRMGILSVGGACGLSPSRGTGSQYAHINGQRARLAGCLGIGSMAADLTGLVCREGDMAVIDVNPLYCAADIPRVYTGQDGDQAHSLTDESGHARFI